MGRNDPCACGSGKRFKSCCGRLTDARRETDARQETAVRQELGTSRETDARQELAELAALLNAGRFGNLEERARALLSARPQDGLLWQLLAAALGGQGKDALPALEAAVRCLPEDPVAHLNVGNALGRRGRLEEAAASFGRALGLQPEFAEAHNNLGDLQLELARFDDAAASCRRALEIRPDFAEAHANLGKALLRLGDADRSVESCRRALEIRPEFAEAHNSLGNALLYLSRFDDAIAGFRQALAINPEFAEAHANLANALRSIGRLDEAVAAYRRALLAAPNFVSAYTELGTALRLQGRTAEAEAACRAALKICPDSAATLTVLAEMRADAGRFIEAEEFFTQVLAIDPQSVEALSGAVRMRRMTPADAGWLAAAQRLAGSRLTPPREMLLRYAIGKYCDDNKDYAQAFRNYRRANELAKLRGPGHDRAHLTRTIDLIIRSHDRTWIGRQRTCANASARPVFIVGTLRSGTTLAEQILASHPQVFGAGELMFWGERLAAATARAGAAAEAREIRGGDGLAAATADYLELLRVASANAARVVDKMPTNFLSLGLIHAALPRARIIHMRRNPVDTCLSIYFQHFEAANSYTNELEDLAHYYCEYRRLMRHWRAALPADAMLEVPYEGLTEDLEGWARRMLEFIDVPWDPRCLAFHATARTVVTASKWQVRQPIDRRFVQRWRNYEKFIQPLLPLLQSDSE
jgi:tetratricopeptide (TPR) repeat protein